VWFTVRQVTQLTSTFVVSFGRLRGERLVNSSLSLVN
jgi:hypothetical protein